jgi:hypothetical protein
MDLGNGFEPVTNAEMKVLNDVEKMFGDKDTALKNIVLYTRLLELDPNDEELKEKLNKMKNRIRRLNKATLENVEKDLKCLDKDGNIISLDNV